MSFVARTIFWLGLVYSAMGLDFGSLLSDRPAAGDASALARCAHGLTSDCRRQLETLRKTVDAAAALGLLERAVTAADAPVAREARPPHRPTQPRSD